MSFVHDVRGRMTCTEGFGLLRSKSFELENVTWRYQGIRNIVSSLSQKSTRSEDIISERRLGGVFKCHAAFTVGAAPPLHPVPRIDLHRFTYPSLASNIPITKDITQMSSLSGSHCNMQI